MGGIVSSVAPDGVGSVSAASVAEDILEKPLQTTLVCSDLTSDLETGTGVARWVPRHDITVTAVYASVVDDPTGQALIADINADGSTIMSTNKLQIDATETDSTTAATQPGLTTTDIDAGTVVTVDIDQVGSGDAGIGLAVDIIYHHR